MAEIQRRDNEEIRELLLLFWEVSRGAMELESTKCKLWFTGNRNKSTEEYVTKIQERIEKMINRKLKNSLTFKKGIPYYMVGATEFINSVLGTEE
ncbi:MAG TPA: hypothetical protein PLB16_10990 [bacterium]|nr:hypothetical protein [bacterium]